MAPDTSPRTAGTRTGCSHCGVAVGAAVSAGISPACSRACLCWRADPLVDDLPDLLVQLVLLPDAVRGAQQHRRDRHQPDRPADRRIDRSEEHTSELQSRRDLVCRLLLEKKKKKSESRHRSKPKQE